MSNKHLDALDPVGRYYGRLWMRLRAFGLVAAALLAFAWLKGLPYVQTDYTYYRPAGAGGPVRAAEKDSAIYVGLTGRKEVRRGEYLPASEGCPAVLFIPLGECWD